MYFTPQEWYNLATMPEPTLLQIARNYLFVSGSYWWFLAGGVLMTFLAFYKHFHPDGKDLILPKWARWASAVLCLIFFHNATPETEAFGKRLQTAMEAAGITVQVEGYGTSYANGPVAPGVSLSVGDDNLDIAKAISELLVWGAFAPKRLFGNSNCATSGLGRVLHLCS